MSYRIASRYAKSLIELAQEKGKLEEVHQDIILLNSSFIESRELRFFLKSPIINTDKKLEILNKLFFTRIHEITSKFLNLMTSKGREGYLHEIAASFISQYNELKGVTPVHITSAVKLEQGTIEHLISNLKTKENLKEVEVTETIDETLVGGFILRYGDKQIDSSVRSSLQRLHNLVADDSFVKKIR